MNAKVEKQESGLIDTLKLVAAALLLIAGVFGFYWFSDVSGALRALALIGVVLLALALAAFTGLGRKARNFITESQFELRKVVWPTRQETIQTTVVILIVVIILSIILWLIDMFLGWVILEKLLKARI